MSVQPENLETVWVRKRVSVAVREGTPAGPILTARAIRDAAEACLTVEVQRFRAGGATWATVGLYLGITRQAAQQRYGAVSPASPGDLPPALPGL